jgi:hypothetical protein
MWLRVNIIFGVVLVCYYLFVPGRIDGLWCDVDKVKCCTVQNFSLLVFWYNLFSLIWFSSFFLSFCFFICYNLKFLQEHYSGAGSNSSYWLLTAVTGEHCVVWFVSQICVAWDCQYWHEVGGTLMHRDFLVLRLWVLITYCFLFWLMCTMCRTWFFQCVRIVPWRPWH